MPDHILRATFTAQWAGQTCQNVCHFLYAEGESSPTLAGLDLLTGWVDEVRRLCVNDLSWITITTQDILPVVSTPVITPTPGRFGQSGFDADAPLQVSLYMKFSSLTAGRRGHGRNYLPGTPSGFFTQGILKGMHVTFFNANTKPGLEGKYLATGSSPLSLLILDRRNPGIHSFVTAINVSVISGTQRRRNVGVGI